MNCTKPYFFYFVIFSTALLSAETAFYYEAKQNPDCLCQGSWTMLEPPEKASEPIISWDIAKQSFRLKESIVEGQNVKVWGRGLFIEAPKAAFRYAPLDKQYWHFSNGASIRAKGIAIDTAEVHYYQSHNELTASQAKFFIKDQGFFGECSSLELHDSTIIMHDLQLTPCPPDDKVWDLRSSELSYNFDADTLYIESPSLYFGDYALLTLPTMSFDGLRAEHRLENLPHISVATQAGVGLSFPMLWTRAEETIEVIPEINLKRGPGIGVNIEKNHVLGRAYLQLLPPSETATRYWMAEIVSADQTDDFAYSYQGALVNDDDFVYRYPHLLVFEERLYYVNRAWARYNLGPIGQVQAYGEKLYRSQEARDVTFEVIENTAHIEWDSHKDFLISQWGSDLFYRYNDKSYWRIYGQQQAYWSQDRQFTFKVLQYPDENFGYGLSELVAGTSSVDIGVGQLSCLILGRLSSDYGSSPLIDTTAQPLSFESLSSLQWHQGRDWVSNGLQITPRLSLELSDEITAHLQVSYAIDKPTQPWTEPTQPYLTPFRENNRFSPVGLNIQARMWEAQALFDGEFGEWVTSEWRRYFYFGRGEAQVGAYFHRYFPMNRLSTETQKVAQLLMNYHSDPMQAWTMKAETRFNLIPVALERAQLHIKYQHCCWNAGIKAAAMQQYDSETNAMKWQYQFGLSMELVGNGLGSKESRRRAFDLMPQKTEAEFFNSFYSQMRS